jgi:hypothetical protein
MPEPTMLVTLAAIETLLERLRRDGVAYHDAPETLSRRASFKEATRVSVALEEAAGRPVFFDRMDGNRFELWVEGPIL